MRKKNENLQYKISENWKQNGNHNKSVVEYIIKVSNDDDEKLRVRYQELQEIASHKENYLAVKYNSYDEFLTDIIHYYVRERC